MKPIYENIQPAHGNSFHHHSFTPGCTEPFWHIHPEYELIYIHSGSAKRHIGTSISRYKDGDLILIGSNIPHSTLGNNNHSDNIEIVFQMGIDFIERYIPLFPEFENISKLFKLSNQGLSFSAKVKKKLSAKIQSTVTMNPFERLIALIEILNTLSNTNDYTLLNANKTTLQIQSNDYSRINRVNNFVANNYHRTIMLIELAKLTNLTESSFCRFFKKVTGKSFTMFLNEYRIYKAKVLLLQNNTSITDVMHETGFSVPAHFTRTFKKHTSYTPSEYRKKIKNG